jgi:hypothetical protein
MITIAITPNQEREMNHHVESHMENCLEWQYQVEMGIEPIDFEPFAPFCSCNTCFQREMLHAAFQFLEKEGIMRLEYKEETYGGNK